MARGGIGGISARNQRLPARRTLEAARGISWRQQ